MPRFKNPFTIKFGGDSELFFGRSEQLKEFHNALLVSGSDYHAPFITGTRGMGKTSLLEQFSKMAEQAGWDVVDTQSEEALKALYHRLAPYDAIRKTTAVKPTITTPFGGGSLGEKSSEKTFLADKADLGSIFIEYCKDHPGGVCVTIDEIQKIPLNDLSLICGAFQLASRKGHNVIIAIAGLPTSYKKVIEHNGCTYMRRASHIQLSLFSPEEVTEAYQSVFGRVKGLTLTDEALMRLVSNSKGQPYMMQLLGYYAIEYASAKASGKTFTIQATDIEQIVSLALDTYEGRVLGPLVAEISNGKLEFLKVAAQVLDADHQASMRAIADALGKRTSDLSLTRKMLLDEELIASTQRGKIRFAIPYLREYLTKPENGNADRLQLLDEWGI